MPEDAQPSVTAVVLGGMAPVRWRWWHSACVALTVVTVSVACVGAARVESPSTIVLHARPRHVANGLIPVADRDYAVLHTDDSRFGRWRLVDDRTGRRTRLTGPPGCVAALLQADRIVWTCHSGPSYVERLATRTLTPVSLPGEPVAVGSRWVEVAIAGTLEYSVETVEYVSLDGGGIHPAVEHPRGTVIADLDAAELSRRVCRPLRIPAELAEGRFIVAGSLSFDGPFAIADNGVGPRLERCGSTAHRPLPGTPVGHRIDDDEPIGDLAADRRLVLWTHERVVRGLDVGVDALQGYLLPSLRPVRIVLPHREDDVGLALDDHTLYIAEQTPTTTRVSSLQVGWITRRAARLGRGAHG